MTHRDLRDAFKYRWMNAMSRTVDLIEVEPGVYVPPNDPRVKKKEPDFTGTFKSSPFIFGTGGGFKPGEGFWAHDEVIVDLSEAERRVLMDRLGRQLKNLPD